MGDARNEARLQRKLTGSSRAGQVRQIYDEGVVVLRE
jgi:hypothetical protein